MSAPKATQGRLQAVFGNLGWLLASNGLTAVLSLVYVGIITRTLGIAEFGRFALIIGAAQTLAVAVSFETWKIVVQYGLEHQSRGDHDALARIQKTAMLIELASAGLGMMCVILLFSIWPHPFGLPGDVKPYALGYALVQLVTLRSTPTGILRLHDKFSVAAAADSVQPIARLIGALLALAFWPTLQAFLLAYALAEMLTTVTCWVLAFRYVDVQRLRHVTLGWRRLTAQNIGLLRFTWTTNLQSSLGLASRQVPLLLVGGFAGPAAAGAFRLAVQLANALSKISTLVMRAAFPEMVRSLRTAPRERLMRFIGQMLLAGLASAAVVMLFTILFGRLFLTLIGGHEFSAAYVMLLWLAGAGCIELALTSFEAILIIVHRAGAIIVARSAALLLQLGALFVLLPLMGASGASISVFIGAMAAAIFIAINIALYARTHDGPRPA
jgi:O-antigen/teichoic acid export membrane protein